MEALERMKRGMTDWRAYKKGIGGRVSDIDGVSVSCGRALVIERKGSLNAGMPQRIVFDTLDDMAGIDVLVVYGPTDMRRVYGVQRWNNPDIFKCDFETLSMLWKSWLVNGRHNEPLWEGLTLLGSLV